IVAVDGLNQRCGLPKSQADAFTCKRIDGTGSVANQSESAAIHAPQTAQRGASTAHSTERAQIAEPQGQLRDLAKGLAESQPGTARSDRDTHFLSRDRGDDNLAVAGPVDLNKIAPGRRTEMLPGGETDLLVSSPLQGRPFA